MFKFGIVYMNEAGPEGSGGGAAPAPAPEPSPTQSVAQGPAPAPAPAPVVEEPKEDKEKEKGTGAEEFEPTGDPSLDYVLSYISEQGLGFDDPAVQAAINGDFAQLEVELLKKGAVGADKIIALAQRSYEQHAEKEKAANEATGQILVDTAGSLEQWEEVVGWAKDNADPDEKEAINTLLQQGGAAARIAAEFLVNSFRGSQGTEFEGQPAAAPSQAAPSAPDTTPLTRVQFAQEAEKLYRQFGNDYHSRPEYRALAQRRAR